MSNNINALIATFPEQLQQNALRQAQTQNAGLVSQQNALKLQQQIAAQNALQGIYADPGNVDPTTGLPKPSALPPLMATGSPMGLDFIELATKLQDSHARANLINIKTREYYTDLFHEGIVDPLIRYAESLPANLPNRDQMIAIERDRLEKLTAAEHGIPLEEQQRWETVPTNIPSWEIQSSQWQKYQELGRKTTPDFYTAKGTDDNGQPYSIKFKQNMRGESVDPNDPTKRVVIPSNASITKDTGRSAGAALRPAKMMYIQQPDGSSKPEPASQTPDGSWVDQHGQPVTVVGGVPTSSPDYAGPQPKPQGDASLTGDAYLAKLPGSEQPIVKAVSEGRMAVPPWAMRDPMWKQIIADTVQYDPSFDATNFNRRNKAYAEFTSGPDGRNIRSINTALNHAAELWHSMDNLAAHEWFKGEGGPIVNWVNQTLRKNIDPGLKGALNRFKTNADQLSSELERAARGDRTSERGVEEWRSNFSKLDTPEALQESIKEAWKLLAGRVDSMQEGFKKAVGPRSEVTDLFTPFAKATYRAFEEGKAPPDISGLVSSATGGSAPAAPGPAPAARPPTGDSWPLSDFPADIQRSPNGTKFNNGKYIKRGDRIYQIGGQ